MVICINRSYPSSGQQIYAEAGKYQRSVLTQTCKNLSEWAVHTTKINVKTSTTEFNEMKGRYSAKNTIKRQEIAARVLLIGNCIIKR